MSVLDKEKRAAIAAKLEQKAVWLAKLYDGRATTEEIKNTVGYSMIFNALIDAYIAGFDDCLDAMSVK